MEKHFECDVALCMSREIPVLCSSVEHQGSGSVLRGKSARKIEREKYESIAVYDLAET